MRLENVSMPDVVALKGLVLEAVCAAEGCCAVPTRMLVVAAVPADGPGLALEGYNTCDDCYADAWGYLVHYMDQEEWGPALN